MSGRFWRCFDFPLLIVTVLLLLYGVAMVFSATHSRQALTPEGEPAVRHLLYGLLGLILLIALVLLDYRLLGSFVAPSYVGIVAVLGLVLVVGKVAHGAQRWLTLGGAQLQPSELSKLVVMIVLAKFFADREEELGRLRTVLQSMLLVGVPAGLTFLQPDLGSALVMIAIWFGMLVMAGLRWRHFLILAGAALAALPFLFLLLQGYMRQRIEVFLNPDIDPLGAGYNVRQALIAVGSGGLFGSGYTNGLQSQGQFLPIQYSDFIFPVVAEELGFVGAIVLLALLAFLLWRALRVASIAPDTFGRLLAIGIMVKLLFQIFVNVGMNLGIMPVAGITLPFISYGGSSLVTTMLSIGILESIALRHKRFEY